MAGGKKKAPKAPKAPKPPKPKKDIEIEIP